ncbi:MAG TPA: LytR C-terminal domain-containing protein [Patescibacteria group bacterium]|nr:LytR C-terminal domain-containing protein [Patescibacteria group bacterium]
MARKKRRPKDSRITGIAAVSILAIITFSLIVRWSGIEADYGLDLGSFQIEVLNGTGETGLAMEMAMKLREMGIDVLIVGDAERYDFDESILIDRKGNPDLMKRLSRYIGCHRVLKQIQPKPLVDATLIIGRDSERLRIDREEWR